MSETQFGRALCATNRHNFEDGGPCLRCGESPPMSDEAPTPMTLAEAIEFVEEQYRHDAAFAKTVQRPMGDRATRFSRLAALLRELAQPRPREPSERAITAALRVSPHESDEVDDDAVVSILDSVQMRAILRVAYAVDFPSGVPAGVPQPESIPKCGWCGQPATVEFEYTPHWLVDQTEKLKGHVCPKCAMSLGIAGVPAGVPPTTEPEP